MSDFTQTKNYGTAIYPVHASDASGLIRRSEPLLTPSMLKSRYLKGIPLQFPNGDRFSDDDLKDKIHLAINEAEILMNMTVTRESFKEKAPFDKSLYDAFIHIRTERGPILSIEHLQISTADGNNIFEIPASWIEPANFSKRLINVIPLIAAFGINSIQGAVANGGIAFLTVLGGLGWVPAYWEVKYTAGMSLKEGQVPVPVNELIGVMAAMDILSLIAPTNIYNSQTLSQDGISQSSSGVGPRIYELRIAELEMKKEVLIKKLKGIFSGKFFVSNI
jgi:hypothetical protein